MANLPFASGGIFLAAPLTLEDLEAGLSKLAQGEIAVDDFWDENLTAFRQATTVAIRETKTLLTGRLPERWRRELNVQLDALHHYAALIDAYVERRQSLARSRLN